MKTLAHFKSFNDDPEDDVDLFSMTRPASGEEEKKKEEDIIPTYTDTNEEIVPR